MKYKRVELPKKGSRKQGAFCLIKTILDVLDHYRRAAKLESPWQ